MLMYAVLLRNAGQQVAGFQNQVLMVLFIDLPFLIFKCILLR